MFFIKKYSYIVLLIDAIKITRQHKSVEDKLLKQKRCVDAHT